MKLALVVSWLNQYGGAERVLEAAHALWPDAPIYTSIYAPDQLPPAYRAWDIHVSPLNRLPGIHRRHQLYLPLYPRAFEAFDLRGYDTIVSITSAFAHGICAPHARHICYCLTPARFLWQYEQYVAHEQVAGGVGLVLPRLIERLRRWDRAAAGRVNEFISISRVVQERITRFYGRDSTIIYPPVDVAAFQPVPPAEVEDYFLIVSRLIPYKRIDLAVRAFNATGQTLVIAGDGRDRARLKQLAGPNIRFVGCVSDAARRDLMARCRAFVFPGEEDFGIAPIEANAAGRPVIAFAGGGALDTVSPGMNGVLFREPTPEALAACLREFDARAFDPARVRHHAEQFDTSLFQASLKARVGRDVMS